MSRRLYWPVLLIVAVLPQAGCSFVNPTDDPNIQNPPNSDNPPDNQTPQISDEAMSDFSVTDANANSPRFGEDVSPRDYLGQVSAWYFGHST